MIYNDKQMSKLFAKKLLEDVVRMTSEAKTSHVGGCLSCLDVVSVLFTKILNIDKKNPKSKKRDRFILSKGHTAAIIYSALANKGFFPRKWLSTFIENGTKLPGHIDHKVPGVEFSTGSLGHGLSVGLGMAIAMRDKNIKSNVYVLVSDGEMNTGSTWESIMFAAHHKVSNLICIVDKNKIQSFGKTKDIINLDPLHKKWEAYGWNTYDIDGHNHSEIEKAFINSKKNSKKPSVIICNTIKGKGIKDFEGRLISHYRPPNEDQLKDILEST
jgi:transketolase